MTDTAAPVPGDPLDEDLTPLPDTAATAPQPRGQTTGGWPYALPTDKRINWPATSQALAQRLETSLGAAVVRVGKSVVNNEQIVDFGHVFAAAPVVIATPTTDGNVGGEQPILAITSVGPNAFGCRIRTPAGGPNVSIVHWIAIGT